MSKDDKALSLLVVTSKGHLRRLECPFEAISLYEYPTIRKGQRVKVNAVYRTMKCPLAYRIGANLYNYQGFLLLLDSGTPPDK